MAENALDPGILASPAVAALKDGAVGDAELRGRMARTTSTDIREEREDLKRAAEQSKNAILELDLQGRVRWVSPSWKDLTGEAAATVIGKPIADLLADNKTVFAECVEAMREDDSKSRIVRFQVVDHLAPSNEDNPHGEARTPVDTRSDLTEEADGARRELEQSEQMINRPINTIRLEAQGIMVYDRASGEESHTMWMVKPAFLQEITIDLPPVLVESLGIGAEMLANHLNLLADERVKQDPQNHPPALPVLCRICERQISPWWFEKHTELCLQEHRAEMEVQLAQETLNEQRSAIVKVLDALEAQSRSARRVPSADSGSPVPATKAEYKGLPIGPNSTHSSNTSSGRASPAGALPRSREPSASGLSHRRARSFAVRRPLARIVELVLDLCDTAMEISTPSVKDTKSVTPGEFRTQSPQSESRVQQVLQWQSPSAGTLENEIGLALLCDETSQLAKSKVEAVFRHRRILEYSERIWMEFDILVQECIHAAMDKAASIAAGEISDSSDDSSKYETPEQQIEPSAEWQGPDSIPASLMASGTLWSLQEDEGLIGMQETRHSSQGQDAIDSMVPSHSGSPSAMAMALRNTSDPSLARRASSADSSGASSPRGTTTPKSYGGLAEPFPLHKRASIAFESDAGGDSDSSKRSSIASGGPRRADSPGAEVSLGRALSTRSRDRKRQSLVLPSLAGRHHSPARPPPQPSSPLRMAKPRVLSRNTADSIPSPITSPVLSTSDFNSPVVRAQHHHHHHHHHHRRQSSNVLVDMLARPTSPRLSAVVSHPQPRAVQTSIKDFEIIKPISKGAFGSVYLSKKKSTGDYYAIKVLKKADMVAKNQVTNVKAERAIMMWQGESDFVAKLYWTFSSKDFLYLVMEYLNGGDCASLIKVLGALPEDWTKKYIAEIVLGVQHLHSRQIVHRDLKPDNLLIDAKGHLKLTDFGLSRMGLIGRQERAFNAKPGDAPPDLLKSGPFRHTPSITSSRSTSFDYAGSSQSPAQTPATTPGLAYEIGQPSYFSLNHDGSRELSRRTSGHRSNSNDSESLDAAFRRFSMADSRAPIEEETASDEGNESPDPYALHTVPSTTIARIDTPPQGAAMPPPIMSLFDPEDSNRRFVGTPDYLAPETINGLGQDEMSDWWSLGCILFECLYGRPPFNADTPEKVFQAILNRDIQWPDGQEEDNVSSEAKDLINRLMCLEPMERLGSNQEEKFANGGNEIKAHSWFADINWDTLREDEASFVPLNDNPENTEYFDARGATMHSLSSEFEDQQSSPAHTPNNDYPDRPHDALSRVRNQVNAAIKRNLMPLHIPAHVRDNKSRRLSEPVVADDFGNFQFKNLPVLEKANKDVIQKLRTEAMQTKAVGGTGSSSPSVISPSPAPSLESSPVMPMPLKRALSANRGHHRSKSPSLLGHANPSPSRGSQPSSPLLVQFSAGQHFERRKTSSGSSSLSHQASNASLQPGNFFDPPPRLSMIGKMASAAPSPIKSAKPGSISYPNPSEQTPEPPPRTTSASSPRQRSHTVGSQEGDLVPELMPNHHKRRSGAFDVSPSSSDTEDSRQKALLRVQRRRHSSRRLSQINMLDGPTFRTLDVLVCEDHPVSRLVMERLLEKLRCRTIAVKDGSEAMRYAMSEVQFDIIMMEFKLPHVNGADVARMIRETRNANSHTPIVAVTGYLKELQAPHHFDALIEKPATKQKLEEVMGQLCQWKAPLEGWKPTLPQAIPSSNLRQESVPTDDSPTTTVSSGLSIYPQILSSSGRGSSREDSIGSSSFGETDSIPVIISRHATNEWDQMDLERNFGGLGISNTHCASPEPDFGNLFVSPPSPAHMHHEVSAPASLGTPEPTGPRKQPSMEEIQAKRRSLEKVRHESAAESGDDEDEELGNTLVRQRSPKRPSKRSSKLGTEMMRTNSQGSVISVDEAASAHRTTTSEPKLSVTSIVEEPAVVAETAAGHLTPPEFFAKQPEHHSEVIDMDETPIAEVPQADLDATPKPHHHSDEIDPDPTPKASASPSRRD